MPPSNDWAWEPMTHRLEAVLAAIDAANEADPGREWDENGVERAAAWLYGRRMTAELHRVFGADVAEVLQIAARGQHIERWALERSTYPPGRLGYLNWRRDQARAHGQRLGAIMADAGYREGDCHRVGVLLRKEGLKRDAEVQMLEDTICMVFLTWYFPGFAAKHPEDKVQDIVGKTARKMSQDARARVLKEFDLPAPLAERIRAAESLAL